MINGAGIGDFTAQKQTYSTNIKEGNYKSSQTNIIMKAARKTHLGTHMRTVT